MSSNLVDEIKDAMSTPKTKKQAPVVEKAEQDTPKPVLEGDKRWVLARLFPGPQNRGNEVQVTVNGEMATFVAGKQVIVPEYYVNSALDSYMENYETVKDQYGHDRAVFNGIPPAIQTTPIPDEYQSIPGIRKYLAEMEAAGQDVKMGIRWK